MGLRDTSRRPIECGTSRRRARSKSAAGLVSLLTLAVSATGDAPGTSWPAFLLPPETFPASIVASVERVWTAPTLARTIEGPTVGAPYAVYVAFVDSPDVSAAAARFRHLAKYEVEPLAGDAYRAEDGAGARGTYRVLAREPRRRVILSHGEYSGPLIGAISGSALSVLDLEPDHDGADSVGQHLTVYVRIDNAVAAAVARLLVFLFGGIADRKLAAGLTVTAKVTEWAVEHPADFCAWLAQTPLDPARQARILAVLPPCR